MSAAAKAQAKEEAAAAAAEAKAKARRPTLELEWQPPEGYSWEDLPSESRLLQAMTESAQIKAKLEKRLQDQLSALADSRALTYLARTQALAAVDPLARSVCRPETVRQGAAAVIANFKRIEMAEAETDEQRKAREAAEAAEAATSPIVRSVRRHLHRVKSSRSSPTHFPVEHPVVREIDRRYQEDASLSPPGGRGGGLAGGQKRRSAVAR